MRVSDARRRGVKEVFVVDGNNNPLWFERYDYPFPQSGVLFTRSDVKKNPMDHLTRWRSPSAYQFEVRELAGWFGDYYHSRFAGDYRRRYSGALNDSFPTVPDYLPYLQWPPYPGTLCSRAETACLLQAQDMKVNLATMFAEGRKAVEGVAGRAMKIAMAAAHLKDRDPKRALRALGYTPKGGMSGVGKSASKDYLEVIYGMIPLMSDIYGFHQEFHRDTVVQPMRFSVRSTASQPFDTVEDLGSTAGARVKYYITGKQYYRCSLTFEVSDATYVIAGRVGLINPATVAWEVVPYSFIVDWMVPVGDWLEAMTADAGLRFVSGTGSRGVKYTYKGEARPDGSAYYAVGNIDCSGSVHSGGRGVYKSTPIPNLYVKNPLSTVHVTNAIALIRSMKR